MKTWKPRGFSSLLGSGVTVDVLKAPACLEGCQHGKVCQKLSAVWDREFDATRFKTGHVGSRCWHAFHTSSLRWGKIDRLSGLNDVFIEAQVRQLCDCEEVAGMWASDEIYSWSVICHRFQYVLLFQLKSLRSMHVFLFFFFLLLLLLLSFAPSPEGDPMFPELPRVAPQVGTPHSSWAQWSRGFLWQRVFCFFAFRPFCCCFLL